VEVTRVTVLFPKAFKTRTACLETASMERRSGVFLSKASLV